jgi:Putative bacterial sensory transduction regulator
MSSAEMGAPGVRPADVEGWFVGLGLTPTERADRDGITSWDLVLDGRRRFDLRITVILDPALALICWAHYAPPISDMFRKSYRRLLRWNDEFPFAKFSVADDERPLLAVEIPVQEASADALGLAIARILGIADRLLDESKDWLWLGGRMPDIGDRVSANEAFLDRYAARLPELLEADEADAVDGVSAADAPRDAGALDGAETADEAETADSGEGAVGKGAVAAERPIGSLGSGS